MKGTWRQPRLNNNSAKEPRLMRQYAIGYLAAAGDIFMAAHGGSYHAQSGQESRYRDDDSVWLIS